MDPEAFRVVTISQQKTYPLSDLHNQQTHRLDDGPLVNAVKLNNGALTTVQIGIARLCVWQLWQVPIQPRW